MLKIEKSCLFITKQCHCTHTAILKKVKHDVDAILKKGKHDEFIELNGLLLLLLQTCQNSVNTGVT